ncbi:unnamed protein product [Calypogeia fissa]
MKLRVAWRNIVHYIRTDLKEIAFPSSLPDPPSSKPKPRKLTFREHLHVWRTGTGLYIQSWRTGTIDDEEEKDEKSSQSQTKSPEEPSILEELTVASRAGSEAMRPALQRIYMTRASAYRDALRSFVEGYQEGIAEGMRASKAMKNELEKEAYSGVQDRHQSNVATPGAAETKSEQHQDTGMRV